MSFGKSFHPFSRGFSEPNTLMNKSQSFKEEKPA